MPVAREPGHLELDHQDARPFTAATKSSKVWTYAPRHRRVVLRAEVEREHLGERLVAHAPGARGQPVHAQVVEDDQLAVAGELAVHVHAVHARVERLLRRRRGCCPARGRRSRDARRPAGGRAGRPACRDTGLVAEAGSRRQRRARAIAIRTAPERAWVPDQCGWRVPIPLVELAGEGLVRVVEALPLEGASRAFGYARCSCSGVG